MRDFSTYKLHCFFLFIILVSCGNIFSEEPLGDVFNVVDHKNLQLSLYLDLIRYNVQEKVGILPYILKNPEGYYLEIGTGGDPVLEILKQLPCTSNVTLIASDIDTEILRALPQRNPKLKEYLDAKQGPRLELMQLDATNLSCFEDDYLSGINASSLVHEIISYAGGLNAMSSFFKEAARSLKKGGILVYRDPESVSDHKAPVTLDLRNKNIRLFAHIFLCKFLDKRGSLLEKQNRKFYVYDSSQVGFVFFRKNEGKVTFSTYEEYLKIPSYDIDFSRRFILTLPCGLYRELARHYLTYLHHCNPLVYVSCTSDLSTTNYAINYFAHSTSDLLDAFFKKNNFFFENGKMTSNQKTFMDNHIESISRVLEFGIPLNFSSNRNQCKLRNILYTHGFSPQTHIVSIGKNSCLLDYRIFGLLYDEITKNVLDEFNYIVNSDDEVHALWLKREGEEFYFYLSPDDLITTMLKNTEREYLDEDGNKQIFVLCPVSSTHNKFIERICYSELLKRSLEIHDDMGYDIDVIDGKRVIHFAKMPLPQAIGICKEIVKQDPMKYVSLRGYLDSLECPVKSEEKYV